jgi:hypothetical protein
VTGLFREAAAAVYNTLAINNSNFNHGFVLFYVDSEIVCRFSGAMLLHG